MLILQPEEVQYCGVSHQGRPQTEILPGLSYYGHLFIKVKSYAQDQGENALKHCRELLELKASVMSIIVEDSTGFTLWSEDKSVKRNLHQPASEVRPQTSATKNPNASLKYRGQSYFN